LILSPRRIAKTAEAAARLLLAQVETLSPIARRCWDKASKRTFDIGVQADMGTRAFEEVRLTPETLSRIASIGARLQVTVYPPVRDEAAQHHDAAAKPRTSASSDGS
jgi:50S ribosomal subunit-associated GTPase HflX